MKIFAVGMNYVSHHTELSDTIVNNTDMVVFTKADKLNKSEREQRLAAFAEEVKERISTSFNREALLVKGDSLSMSIAAASVLAKVSRDRYVTEVLDKQYPQYRFARHKGYGTAQHIEALRKYGPCPLHRRSFIGGILGDRHE